MIAYDKMYKVHYNRFDADWIIRKANESYREKTIHITDVVSPMSEGNKHDYYSNGDYWWPNPEMPGGLPYIQRDGESNPDCFSAHRTILRSLRSHVANLAAAYKITGDEAYAQKAVQHLKEFFLDGETRMKPHLLYSQAIPGICSGRSIGIIDTLHLIDIPFAVNSLKSSYHLKQNILNGLRQWFEDYLEWMLTHPYGIEEMNAPNNHGVCWFVQAAVFSLFTDNIHLLNLCRDCYKNKLLPSQMDVDGSFPRELKRTKPYGYSIFVLDNMVTLCHILSTPEDDLWEFELEDGRSIKRGLDYLYPYLADKSKWPFPRDVQHFDAWPARMSFLLFAGCALGDKKFIKLWEDLEPESMDNEVRRNIAIRQPILWL